MTLLLVEMHILYKVCNQVASLKIVSALNLISSITHFISRKKEHPDLCKIQSKPLGVIITDNFEEKKLVK